MVDECEFDIMDSDHESRINDSEIYCPQCGEDVEVDLLVEGYCKACTDENYNEMAVNTAQERWWNSLSEDEKRRQVENQLRFTC